MLKLAMLKEMEIMLKVSLLQNALIVVNFLTIFCSLSTSNKNKKQTLEKY